jgi:hypothetical protein
VTLAKLHRILQAAMGWSDSHLHAFRVGDRSYGMQEDDYDDDELDETSTTVLEAIDNVGHFSYDYDFGDGWEHQVVVEERMPQHVALKLAVCLGGEHACPPDDVGGPGGYAEFLLALADPGHEEHRDFMDWVGGSFDPAAFDIGAVNIALQKIR